MDDIYLNEKHSKAKKKHKKNKPWSSFFFNLLNKWLLLTALLTTNFILFANAGSYSIFETPQQPTLEVCYILTGIVVSSFLIIYILSFSTFFQNLFLCTAFVYVAMAFLNQFALFNKDAMLYGIISSYFGNISETLFISYSHYIVIGFLAVSLFFFLALAPRNSQAYFTGIVLLIMCATGANIYFSSRNGNTEFRVSHNSFPPSLKNKKAKKFIYIGLPELASIIKFQDLEQNYIKNNNKVYEYAQKTQKNMLGFFEQNNFTIYPNSYVIESNPFLNLVQSLNPSTPPKKIDENILKLVELDGLWNFKDLSNQYIYLKNNQLFQAFKKAKYNISVYQSRDLELCANNKENVNKCIRKQNIPANLNGLNLSQTEKTALLFGQWIESWDAFKDYSFFYSNLKPFFDLSAIPLVSFSTSDFYVLNTLDVFDIMADDIIKDKNNHAYFAYADIPSNLYIYDEFCRVRPLKTWQRKDEQPWIIHIDSTPKIQAYNQQLNCLFGKLEEFIQKLQEAGVADDTVIILQGLSSHNTLDMQKQQDFITEFKNEQQVMLAIRDPLKKESSIKTEAKFASDIIKEYLFKNPSNKEELAELNMHHTSIKKLLEDIKRNMPTKEEMKSSQTEFNKWYEEWKKNSPQKDVSLQPQAETPKKKIIPKIAEQLFDGKPAIPTEEKSNLENEIKAFSETVQEEKNEDQPTDKDVSIKIIEGEQSQEVAIPENESEVNSAENTPVTPEEEAEPQPDVVSETPEIQTKG